MILAVVFLKINFKNLGYMCVSEYMHMSVGTLGGQRMVPVPTGSCGPLSVCCGSELRSSARAARALYCLSSPAVLLLTSPCLRYKSFLAQLGGVGEDTVTCGGQCSCGLNVKCPHRLTCVTISPPGGAIWGCGGCCRTFRK